MNCKQRVHAALRRQPVDRVPVFMALHPETVSVLAKLLDVPRHCVEAALGNDVRMSWVNNDYYKLGLTHDRDGEGHQDFWGIRWVRQGADNEVAQSPLAGSTSEQVRKYCFPLQHAEELLSRMNPLVGSAYEHFVGCDVSPCVFEMYGRLRGREQALADLEAEPALISEMLDRCAAFAALLAELVCRRFPLDWLWTGDDVAGPDGLRMSPETWRSLIKPHLQLVLDAAKRHRVWVVFDGRGAMRAILPDLVEMGVEVLHVADGHCPGMDPLELKREFGAKLGFLAGPDPHGVLTRGSVDDVRRATRRLLDGMTAEGGGYVLAAGRGIPPEVPSDNLFAMLSEAGIPREEIYDRAADIRAKYRPGR